MQTDTAMSDTILKHVPYGRQCIDESDIQAVVDVLRSDWLTQGPKSKEFEEKFAAYCGARYAVSVTSGTAALHLSCLASGIGPGDEVITSPITFAASSNCALYVGATPAFVDIDPETICLDPEKFAEYLRNRPVSCNASQNTKPKAVIPVHFAGLPCDMKAISKSAMEHGLIIIEDACHAHGARYASGERVGSCTYSDMTVFSFHPLKNMTTGEGGMITTNDPDLYEKLILLRTHGISKDNLQDSSYHEDYYYEMQLLGFNYRMNDIQSALGISQLKKLDTFLQKRRETANYYFDSFKGLDDYITLPPDSNGSHAWHIYVIQLRNNNRDYVFRNLREAGMGVQVHYIPVYLFPYYQKLGYGEGLCPYAEEYFSRAVTIPLYSSMNSEDMKFVVERVCEAVKV